MNWRTKIITRGESKVQETVPDSPAPPKNWREKVIVKKKPKVAEPVVLEEPEPVVEEKVQEEPVQENINKGYDFDPAKTYLVVGGKVKQISSKSKYLLDMLIIKEEN